MEEILMTKTPAIPVNKDQAIWLMEQKKITGESYGTIIRLLINDAMRGERDETSTDSTSV